MYELTKGIDYCHKHGILHRNLKPENIMITNEGHVIITDFSLSRLITIPHSLYTPEVLLQNVCRIQKRENVREEKQGDYGIELLNYF